MEELFKQEYVYSLITPFKNYSKLPQQTHTTGTYKGNSYNDIFGSTTTKYYEDYISIQPFNLNEYSSKRKLNFFSIDDYIDEPALFRYARKNYINGNVNYKFLTTKDRHIKKHYGEPFSEIEIHLIRRSIIRNGDKITIKAYRHSKHRFFNCKYFKKNTFIESLTINTKTGNFTTLTCSIGRKGIKKTTFRTNSFNHLKNSFINGPDGPFRFLRNHTSVYGEPVMELSKKMNDYEFNKKIKDVLGFDTFLFGNGAHFKEYFYSQMIEWFIKTKKIKVPNNYVNLLTSMYPTEKYLKKNDRKLVASILDLFQIKSKITIKILHEEPDVPIDVLCRLCYLFGDDFPKYIGSINKNIFQKSKYRTNISSPMGLESMSKHFIPKFKTHGFLIKDIEKENLVKLFNSDNKEGLYIFSDSQMLLLWDHFKMINRIREFDPDLIMNATTWNKFDEEHSEFTKIIRAIKKGYVIQYVYPEISVNQIQQPIKVSDVDDYKLIIPFILTREEEYVEEGSFMHHCVATYAETDTSMIVSLRTEDKQDRVTCEFNLSDGRLIQARHFNNRQPPPYFNYAIEQVSDIIRLNARFGTLGWIKKEKVPVKINGVEVKKEDREPRRLIDILDLDDIPPLPF